MRRECREYFPRHRLQRKPLVSDPACITARVSRITHVLVMHIRIANGAGIPGACTTRNFTYLARGHWINVGHVHQVWASHWPISIWVQLWHWMFVFNKDSRVWWADISSPFKSTRFYAVGTTIVSTTRTTFTSIIQGEIITPILFVIVITFPSLNVTVC